MKLDAIANYTSLILRLAPPGPIAEFGVYNGGNVWRLAEAGREVWAFDTFQGLPAQEYTDEDVQNQPGKFKPEAGVLPYLRSLPNVFVFEGRFIDMMPMIPTGIKFACIFLDCDYYLSCKQVLEYMDSHGHMGPGTIIVFDDYNTLPGAKRAIDEWRGTRPVVEGDRVIYYA